MCHRTIADSFDSPTCRVDLKLEQAVRIKLTGILMVVMPALIKAFNEDEGIQQS